MQLDHTGSSKLRTRSDTDNSDAPQTPLARPNMGSLGYLVTGLDETSTSPTDAVSVIPTRSTNPTANSVVAPADNPALVSRFVRSRRGAPASS